MGSIYEQDNLTKELLPDMIEKYPRFSRPDLDQRALLHPLFQKLSDGISEFTFAGILFVGHEPVAYALGEELTQGKSFAIHFEKAS